MDSQAIRAAALLASAVAHSGADPAPRFLTAYASALVPWITGPGAASQMTIAIEGDPVPLTVDSVNAKAVLSFADDHGDPVPPPTGAVATVTSSDTAVLTAGTAVPGTDPVSGAATIEFPLTEVATGTAVLSVHVTAIDGSPLPGPDGVTPIPDAAPVTVTVNPGAPAAERFTVPGA